MALRTADDDTESKQNTVGRNPGQDYYDREFQKLSDRENLGAYEQDFESSSQNIGEDPATKNIDNVRNAEDEPGWVDNTTTDDDSTNKTKIKFWKKSAPIAIIITILFGGSVGIGFFGGSSLFLVNISEVLHDKFNTSLASLDDRSNKIIRVKVKGTISGVCSNVVSLACKYGKLSADEIKGFSEQGIDIVDKEGKVLSADDIEKGKVRPANYRFKGKDISASAFPNEMKNAEFRSKVLAGLEYNAKVASVNGKVWQKLSGALKVSKKAPFDSTTTTDEERLAKIETDTKEGATVDGDTAGDSKSCKDPTKCTPEEEAADDAKNGRVTSDLEPDPDTTTKAATAALEDAEAAAGRSVDAVASSLKVTGVADTACSIYSSIKAVGFAAKTVRAAQLARYAMIYLTTASMIKAGVADGATVSFLAGTLTALYVYKDIHGKTTKSSATDTLAYRNAAFGDTGKLDTTANQFMTGGGLVGDISGVLSAVTGILGGQKNVNTTCGVLANPIVQAGSLVIGIAAWIFPGSDIAMGAKEVVQIGGSLSASVVEALLPGMLKDIVAGRLIDKTIIGAAAGDALISGVGSLMSANAQYSANAPLTPDQAVAYVDYQNEVASRYAEQDRLTANPLDASDPNTFLGTIFTGLTRYSSAFSSVSDALSNSASIVTDSLSGILSPQTKALSAADYESQDPDYQNLGSSGIATDYFGNVIRGIPPVYLNAAPDPDVLSNQLLESGDVDSDGEPLSQTYKDLVTNCIDRSQDTPLGDGTNGGDDGADCIITDQTKANLYIHYIDQRANDQMINGMYSTNATTNSTNVVVGTGGDSGGTGVTPTGGTTYTSLTGSDFSTKINSVGSGNYAVLPTGSYIFKDFAYGIQGRTGVSAQGLGAYGAQITKGAGILGAGSKYSTISMVAGTSTKKDYVPPEKATGSASARTNQLQYILVKGVPSYKIDGVKIIGTDQGHLYNGLDLNGLSDVTISNTTVTNVPGNDSGPPGETFSLNLYNQPVGGVANFTNVTMDGGKVAAVGIGLNSVRGTVTMRNLLTENTAYSAGVAGWQMSGTDNYYNWVNVNSVRSYNAERHSGTSNFYDPVWSEPTPGHSDVNYTWESGWKGGSINFYFTDAAAWQNYIASRTTKKITIVTNPHGQGDIRSTVHVYVGGKAQTTTDYVQWNGKSS